MYQSEDDKLAASAERKATFLKYALIEKARRRELQKLQTISEDEKKAQEKEKNQTATYWRSGVGPNRYDESEFAYVEQYKKKFEEDDMLNDSTNSPANNGASEQDCGSTIKEVNDKVAPLPVFRGRGRGSKYVMSTASSSICRLEETSTAMAPTIADVPRSSHFDNDYTSTIPVGEIQKSYFRGYKINTTLPIAARRDFILSSINSYNVCIIDGATGCGKTTQVPLYILEDAILDCPCPNRPCPVIYVTQPRRIAARSIAKRVCEERGWELGSIVGYQVGLDKKVSPQTVLCFCTAGVLLQKLISEKTLTSFSHIIVDEAHERDADTDLLMMLIKTLMRKEKSFFKLVVMSATMDMEKLKTYFTSQLPFGHVGISLPALCHVMNPEEKKNRKGNEISIIYYDKLRSTFSVDEPCPEFIYEEPMIYETCYIVAAKLILNVIPHIDTFCEETKSTLVFLPGLAEITKIHRLLISMKCPDHVVIIPLHSCLSNNDQNRVFEVMKPGHRKVILATNIAESSITVKDIGFIIDFCLTKNLVKDPITRFPVLKLEWSTQDKATQRAGRTGRCCVGKVFRLVPIEFFEQLPQFALPELLVAPLELSVLRVKNFQMGELKSLFALVLDPPPLQEIKTAVLELKQIGGLSSTYNGELTDIDGDLTELGRIISVLPIDVHLSKLIVIASLLDVMDDAIIIAASLSTNRTVVRHIYGDMYETYINKFNWSKGSKSDLFINLDVYKEYKHFQDTMHRDQHWLDNWCRSHLLDEKKLNEVSALVQEITIRLEQINVKTIPRPNLGERNADENHLMLKIAFCASFWPNYFLNNDFDIPEVKKALCTLDPTKTVIVGNLPIDQCPLYCDQIVTQISDKIKATMDYVTDNSRALIVIKNTNRPVKDLRTERLIGPNSYQPSRPVDLSVYLAIKYAECDRIVIREYQTEAAAERMRYYTEQRKLLNFGHRIPPPWMKIIRYSEKVECDNSRILNITDEEYAKIDKDFYMEIPFDEYQNRRDLHSLDELERLEDLRVKQLKEVERSKLTTTDKEKKGREMTVDEIPNHPVFKEYRKLRGPTSPVQMSFYPILEKSRGFSVEVDRLSVNSVLLDPDFDERRSQMLVAASVGHNKGNKVVARDTTLMPRVKGLPTVLSLMFAQYYRLIFNKKTKSLSGAVFGLGWDEEDKPLDKEFEVQMNFDIHLTKLDIDLINECRRIISQLIRNIDLVQNPGAPRSFLQEKLRGLILTILRRRRYPLPEPRKDDGFYDEGETYITDRHNVPNSQLGKLAAGATRVFLPIIEATIQYDDIDLYKSIRDNLDHMERIQSCLEKPPIAGIRCLLCGNGRTCYFQMHNKICQHLRCEEHLNNLAKFEEFEEKAKRILEQEAAEA